MNQIKADFLQHKFADLCADLNPQTAPAWGKMNVQQMVEHMADYVRIASGKTPMEIVTEAERLPRMQAFLASEKPFPENTPNVLMPDTPPPFRNATMALAIEELRSEINYLFHQISLQPEKQLPNPFFGLLNWDMQVQLLHKHGTHHLRQFGCNVAE